MPDIPPIPAVQTFGLARMYGSLAALSGLDLTVNQGDLFGFIGSNGAGKTTTLRILATFLAPSAGRAMILGHDVVPQNHRPAGTGRKERGEDSQGGGLARAVGADEAE